MGESRSKLFRTAAPDTAMAPAATPAAAKGAYSPSGTDWALVLTHCATSRISSGSAVNFVALRVVDFATKAKVLPTTSNSSGARISRTHWTRVLVSTSGTILCLQLYWHGLECMRWLSPKNTHLGGAGFTPLSRLVLRRAPAVTSTVL